MKKWFAGVIFAVFVLLDQATKYLAKLYLEGQNPVSVLPDIFEFCYLEGGNTGAAFGLFRNNTFLLSIVSLVVFFVIIGFFWKISKNPGNKWLSFCLVSDGCRCFWKLDRPIFPRLCDRFFIL